MVELVILEPFWGYSRTLLHVQARAYSALQAAGISSDSPGPGPLDCGEVEPRPLTTEIALVFPGTSTGLGHAHERHLRRSFRAVRECSLDHTSGHTPYCESE